MGSPDFAVPALRALHGAGHDIAAVYCQPARPAGRGQAVRRCPVHVGGRCNSGCRSARRPVSATIRTRRRLRALDLDAAVVAAYGLILPQAMLDAPGRGCLNIHASLLPRWRGAAPIQAAILAGDSETGITIMQMEAGLDTGPMLLQQIRADHAATTTATLHDSLARLGRRLDPGRSRFATPACPAAPRRRDLRAEAVPRSRPDRLEPVGGRDRSPGAGIRPVAGDLHDFGGHTAEDPRASTPDRWHRAAQAPCSTTP